MEINFKKQSANQAEVYIYSLEDKWLENFMLFWNLKSLKAIVINSFLSHLQLDDKNYKWEKPHQASFPQATCLCQKVNTKISEKANQMNRNIDALSFYLPKGEKSPLLYINRLDLKKQTIEFDFVFKFPRV